MIYKFAMSLALVAMIAGGNVLAADVDEAVLKAEQERIDVVARVHDAHTIAMSSRSMAGLLIRIAQPRRQP